MVLQVILVVLQHIFNDDVIYLNGTATYLNDGMTYSNGATSCLIGAVTYRNVASGT